MIKLSDSLLTVGASLRFAFRGGRRRVAPLRERSHAAVYLGIVHVTGWAVFAWFCVGLPVSFPLVRLYIIATAILLVHIVLGVEWTVAGRWLPPDRAGRWLAGGGLLVPVLGWLAGLVAGEMPVRLSRGTLPPAEIAVILAALGVVGASTAAGLYWLAVLRLKAVRPGGLDASEALVALHQAARTQSSEEEFLQRASAGAAAWARAAVTLILPDAFEGGPREGRLELAEDEPLYQSLHQLGWVTPERLERRTGLGETQLRAFMARHRLAALVVSSGAGTPVVVAVGERSSRQAWRLGEIQILREFAAVIELGFNRVRLLEQTVQNERLAMAGLLSASLAHEIRNPLYAIKAFTELLPEHYDRAEFRVQFSRMVGDEVVRIEELMSGLMSLASPQKRTAARLHLRGLITTSLELVEPRARSEGILLTIRWHATHDLVMADLNSIRQVVLNLCLNAVQALQATPHPRQILLTAANRADGWIELAVSDNGPGIAPSIRHRLFQRFQTTSTSGLGIGLCICREIMTHLHGTLEVDPPAEGLGATFRLALPTLPRGEPAAGQTTP